MATQTEQKQWTGARQRPKGEEPRRCQPADETEAAVQPAPPAPAQGPDQIGPPAPPAEADTPPPCPTRVRYLAPGICTIHLGSHGALHVTVTNERIYGGVFAAYAFPVAHAEQFISLLYSNGEGKDIEIGVIRDLREFSDGEAELVRQALARRYFIHRVRQIHKIGWKHGMICLDLETDKGRIEVLMQWQHSKAVDYGRGGKVLIDLHNNRYLIPDLQRLSPREQRDFQRVIYW
jgi:hypothetical protein